MRRLSVVAGLGIVVLTGSLVLAGFARKARARSRHGDTGTGRRSATRSR
ncbi:hypothetical protein [Actinomadura sp. NBRC 104412]|nr:hypothetical protein [Actinomadura sp. NBRC 104412]